MKFIKYKSNYLLAIILLAFGIGFHACNSDDEIVPKTLEQYKAELSAIVSSEKVKVQNCVMGYDKDNFRIDTALYFETIADYNSALADAESILAKDGLTIADVMDANYLITKPGDVFNDNTWISDRRPLDNTIKECETLQKNTPEGNEPGMAPVEAHERFSSAISTGKSVRGRSTTIDRQVTEAVDELNQEQQKFEDAIIK
jgi:hypothetical protein